MFARRRSQGSSSSNSNALGYLTLLNISFYYDPLFRGCTWFQMQSNLKNFYKKVKTWLAMSYSMFRKKD